MQKLNATAAAILTALAAGLADPTDPETEDSESSSRHVGGKDRAFMQVIVERIAPTIYSIAHYGTQNGDLMADPEMTFHRGRDGGWYPLSFTNHYIGVSRRAADVMGDKVRVDPREQAEQTAFADAWMVAIREQQSEWFETSRAA